MKAKSWVWRPTAKILRRSNPQDRYAERWQLSAQHELLQAARKQPGNAGLTRRNGAPGAAFLRQDGEALRRARASPTPRSRSAIWISHTPCSIVFEEVFFHLANELHKRVPDENLAMAGGCALNSVANGKLFARTPFRRTWIQPAAGDEGLAIGAALHTYHSVLQAAAPRRRWIMPISGPSFPNRKSRSALNSARVKYQRLEREPLLDAVSDQMVKGNVVGWFQGRMEWGPRALGNRSIVTHPACRT